MPFASSPKQPNLHTIITVSQICKEPLQTASTAVCVVDEILASVALVLLEVMLQRRPDNLPTGTITDRGLQVLLWLFLPNKPYQSLKFLY
jgi:hypothetical protein